MGTQLGWTLGGAGTAALAVTVVAYVVGGRRQREHERLLRESVRRLCAQRADPPTETRQRHRDLVDLLVRQDEAADLLERTVRPVLSRSPVDGVEDVVRAVPATIAIADRLLRSAGDASLLADSVGPGLALDVAELDFPEFDVGWSGPGASAGPAAPDTGPLGPVPRPEQVPKLAEAYTILLATVREQVELARAVLAHAARLGEPAEACRRRLTAAFDQADEACRVSVGQAGAGQTLPALRTLVWIELPIPEDGVPGGAGMHRLRRLTRILTAIALRHRDATARWCAAALARCGTVPA